MQTSRTHPIIGLTTYGRNADNRYTLPAEYVDAVRRAGGVPLLLAPGGEPWELGLEILDALILTGGGDIEPSRYGGKGHPANYAIDSERDASELSLAQHVLDSGLPALAICRGAQIFNVALGGTLIEHIPDEVGERVLHRAPPREPIPHRVSVQPDSRLAEITGRTDFEVASWHHQALKEIPEAFDVVAHAPDGTIEAVEVRGHPWLLAVQWHPELTAASDPLQQRLFDAIVEAARGHSRRQR
jgi:putative glutamine amidotransferase